ncbi:hypothetical protein [Aeromonas dhakensis]|uniref:hypothetical protein n=1 Tax=Aeromonas dhakensis TaxID=196024 RepID=UPI0013DEC0D4|nr:hypothetical protein [Aeromonas dhakensis]
MKRKNIVQTVILLIAIILVLIALKLQSGPPDSVSSNWYTILLSIGCSIIAVVIINIVEYQIILSEVNTIKIVNSWKLVSIFETRAEMNIETNRLLQNASELDIAALGSRGLINFQGDIIKEKLKKGLKIRFLVPRKDSDFISQREIDEGATAGEIKNNIDRLIEWVESTKRELSLNNDEIVVREYSSLPVDSIMRIDGNIFVGPFMIGKLSQLTMAYQYKKGGKGYQYYEDYFNRIWNDENISHSVRGN